MCTHAVSHSHRVAGAMHRCMQGGRDHGHMCNKPWVWDVGCEVVGAIGTCAVSLMHKVAAAAGAMGACTGSHGCGVWGVERGVAGAMGACTVSHMHKVAAGDMGACTA